MESVDLEADKLGQLLEVGRGLVAQREPDEVLIRVLEAARELTGARYAAIGILDAEKRGLARFLTVGIDEETRRRIGPLPRGHGILGELIRNPRPLRLARIGDHPRSYGFPAEHPPMETFLGVPVKVRDEVFGNLYLTEKESGEFDEDDEHLLIVLAEWAAVAVDNARAHEVSRSNQDDLERVTRGLEATASLNREVIGRADLERVLELIVKRVRDLADARLAVLMLLEGEALRVAAVAGEAEVELLGTEPPFEGVVARDVLRSGSGQIVGGQLGNRVLPVAAAAQGGLLVPLRARGTDIGVLGVFDKLTGTTAFGDEDLKTLESFGTGAANAIAFARAVEDERLSLSIASSERERKRWARELHDETLQELGALNMMQEAALQSSELEPMQTALERSNQQVAQIITNLQGLITELRPAALDQLGVEAALEALAERVENRTNLKVSLDVDLVGSGNGDPARLAPELEAGIYRLVQESLTNVIKHADATEVRVKLEANDDTVTATVEDDGRGFDPADTGSGFGLLGMGERVALLGGNIQIDSAPGEGTRLTATLSADRRP